MRRLIAWATANPILTISAALVPLCIAAIVYVAMSGTRLKEDATAKVQGKIATIRRLMKTPVEVPSDDPDSPMASISLCVTQSVIEQRSRIRDEMGREHRKIFSYAVERNRDGLNFLHEPMIPGLFPGHQSDPSLSFRAQKAYMQTLAKFTMKPKEGATTPRLNGGRPLSSTKIQMELEQIAEDFDKRHHAVMGNTMLDAEDERELFDEKRQVLLGLLHEHAKNIQMYVHASRNDREGGREPAGRASFHVGDWVHGGDKPTLEQLWEGQLDLWIQQDIVEAIAMTNHGAENVLAAPVKRLVQIVIEPGYVGINTEGAVREFDATRYGANGMSDEGRGGTPSFSGAVRSRGAAGGIRTRTPDPMGMRPGNFPSGTPSYGAEMQQDTESTEDEEQIGAPVGSIEENYELSLTGRQSNALYDVRHTVVTVIVDSKRIGQFLDNVSRVNFMTVLLVAVNDVDEFEHLRGTGDGHFFYGPHDAVQLTIVIESLWLRRWTAGHWDRDEAERLGEPFDMGLMPESVRALLKLNPRVGTRTTRQVNSEF